MYAGTFGIKAGTRPWKLFLLTALAAIMTATPLLAGQKGGVMRLGIKTDLTQVDEHKSSAQIDNLVFYMTVLRPYSPMTEKYRYKPFLCESYKYSDGGKVMTLNLE